MISFFSSKENVNVAKLFATIAYHIVPGQLQAEVNQGIITALVLLHDKHDGQLFYLVLKAINRNIRSTSNTVRMKIIDRLFLMWG